MSIATHHRASHGLARESATTAPGSSGGQDPTPQAADSIRIPDDAAWRRSLRAACRWIIRCSTVTDAGIADSENIHHYPYADWSGCVREYDARTGKWMVFAPAWHTGQAVKALVMAHRVLGDDELLAAARHSARFLLNAQVRDPDHPDHGLIVAYENGDPTCSWTSCMLESLDGLIHLGHATGDASYLDAMLAAARWAQRRVWLNEQALFLDEYDPIRSQARSASRCRDLGLAGRPLIDDGIFLSAAEHSRDDSLAEIFLALAERLLTDEDPAGNWIQYPPCHRGRGLIHPRHGYWWGRPMLMAWRKTGDERFRACARRCADWYERAQRRDGGMFRETDVDFNTSSFGHAASGSFCAASLWCDLIEQGDGDHAAACLRALNFGYLMQMHEVADENLRGCIVEKICMPDGTDRCTYLVRDLASIFYVQAVVRAMQIGLIAP